MDDLCLVRALDLLNFWQREAEIARRAQEEASKGRTPNYESIAESVDLASAARAELTEDVIHDQMESMQNYLGKGLVQMPKEIREALDWAEAEKAKRRGLLT